VFSIFLYLQSHPHALTHFDANYCIILIVILIIIIIIIYLVFQRSTRVDIELVNGLQ